ncbi:MAG TPA: zf-HC2 domain-containing protein [Blastocatellia bacterium]|nr:zf-HC2 domain-containing protein [Blastocatellia bacterium]
MDCSRFEEHLTDYLDGQLAPPTASLFASHALQCRDCRQILDDVRAVVKECREDEEIQTPAGLEATLARIAIEHKPIDCPTFEEIITEFLDGFVPASVYHRFETHSADCAECSTLLTDVVYAVAACHSVHTYEEYEVPQCLIERLEGLMPAGRRSLARSFRDMAVAVMSRLMPTATQGAAWSFTTASMLVFATCGLLLFGVSDDRTVGGIYRQAHVKAAELYSQGAGIYAQKHEVVARLQEVGSNLGEIWSTLGGDSQSSTDATAQPSEKTPGSATEPATGQ